MLIPLNQIVLQYNLHINGVIHVGAHIGQEYPDYVYHGIKNMLFFEPVPVTFKTLLENITLSDTVKAYNIALGNETGVRDMYIEKVNTGQSSSLLEPGTHLEMYPHIIFDNKEEIRIDKLDNIEFDRASFNMINIDIQGFELEMFKGAIKTLPFIDIIYTEINTTKVYKDCCLVEELDDFLELFGFTRVLTDLAPIQWGDALYLKNYEK